MNPDDCSGCGGGPCHGDCEKFKPLSSLIEDLVYAIKYEESGRTIDGIRAEIDKRIEKLDVR